MAKKVKLSTLRRWEQDLLLMWARKLEPDQEVVERTNGINSLIPYKVMFANGRGGALLQEIHYPISMGPSARHSFMEYHKGNDFVTAHERIPRRDWPTDLGVRPVIWVWLENTGQMARSYFDTSGFKQGRYEVVTEQAPLGSTGYKYIQAREAGRSGRHLYEDVLPYFTWGEEVPQSIVEILR